MLKNLIASLFAGRRPAEPVARVLRAVTELLEADRLDDALALAAQAVARDPRAAESHLALALAWQKSHEPVRALESCAVAERLQPGNPALHDLRGAALQELGRLDEAMAGYERALALDPGYVHARYHRGLLRLLRGEFALGWEDYELRRIDVHSALHPSTTPTGLPYWDGSPLDGRAILVRREQGLGDEIMFASLLPELSAGAGRVMLECDARLRGLFARSFPGIEVLGEAPPASLRADVETGSASLARYLRRDAADFPSHGGYLAADPARVSRWRQRLSALGGGPKVGISWTGGVRRTRRALRSIPLRQWGPILAAPGMHFVSLQYTEGAAAELQEAAALHGSSAHHWPEAIADYEETAALVCSLDLVISVCTAVVHLAGALARPVWVLAPLSPEWRYGFSGAAMPWYPSARIFRQGADAQWAPVIDAIGTALRGGQR
jgi:tetratricopeptide (TPR) repeat protein